MVGHVYEALPKRHHRETSILKVLAHLDRTPKYVISFSTRRYFGVEHLCCEECFAIAHALVGAGSKFFLPPKNSEKDRRHFPNSYAHRAHSDKTYSLLPIPCGPLVPAPYLLKDSLRVWRDSFPALFRGRVLTWITCFGIL